MKDTLNSSEEALYDTKERCVQISTHPRLGTDDKVKKITKVQFIELMSFIGVSYRNIGEELLKGLEMTKRQLYFQSPPSPAWITSLESWNPGPPYTTCRQLKRWEIPQMLQNMEISWKDSSIQFFVS